MKTAEEQKEFENLSQQISGMVLNGQVVEAAQLLAKLNQDARNSALDEAATVVMNLRSQEIPERFELITAQKAILALKTK